MTKRKAKSMGDLAATVAGAQKTTETAAFVREGPRGGKTTPGGLIRVSVYLTAEERAAVRDMAHREDRTVSDVLRAALRDYVPMGR